MSLCRDNTTSVVGCVAVYFRGRSVVFFFLYERVYVKFLTFDFQRDISSFDPQQVAELTLNQVGPP
jgi:hypothetical protein